jgi:hypothetical protein
MANRKKTWTEKLDDPKGLPKAIDFSNRLPCGKTLQKLGAKPGDCVILVPPLEIKEIMSKVPRGKLTTLNEICNQLAKRHKTDYCCTLTAGIFVMIVANATEETQGNLPYWRTIKNTGELNAKYPGGLERHKELLEKEGFKICQKGKKYLVEDFRRYLHHSES